MTKTLLALSAALAVAGSSVPAAAHETASAPTLNDAQIATIALTAHQIDADRGRVAAKSSRNELVKAFAEQMAKDHDRGAKEVLKLAKKLGVTPEESDVTRSLKDGAEKTGAELAKLEGAAFDKAYIDAEVAFHQAVIDAVKTVLIPTVKNEKVKKALIDAGPLLEGHLVHARHVQKTLAGGT